MIETSITPVSQAQQMLQRVSTPQQSKEVEIVAAAAQAWAKEQGDYEMLVKATKVYVLARRKTTELIIPEIKHGGDRKSQEWNQGDNVVTLMDFGFDKKQWNRRTKELEVTLDDIDAYFDECIANHWEPSLYGMLRFVADPANPHVSYNSGVSEWYTPPEYIQAAREVMSRIDLDPASSEIANRIVKADRFYTAENDGLSKFWAGKVWLNPPYATELIVPFIAKYADHVRAGDVTEGIVLVNNATETNWFNELASVSTAIVFPKGRVRFLDPDGNPGAPLQGQAVVYTGKNAERFISEFSKFGWCAELC